MKKLKKMLFPILVLFTVSSCGPSNKDSIVKICKSDSELCSDLHNISDCRYKRSSLIRARYYDKIEPSNEHTINLLDELDIYESCLELTLMMEFTKAGEKKAHNRVHKENRIENYYTAKKLMKEKLKEVKKTKEPHIAYYLWTHYQDLTAKKVFLKAASQKDTKDINLLLKLAALYNKSYSQYSLNIYYKALKISKSLDEIPNNTFVSILTIFYQNKNFEQAYIWALLAKKVNTRKTLPIDFDLILQKGLKNNKKLIMNEKKLQKIANTYYQKLKQGKFNIKTPKLL